MRVRSSRSKRFVYGSVCRLSFPLPFSVPPSPSLAPLGQQNGDKFKCNKFLFALQQTGKWKGAAFFACGALIWSNLLKQISKQISKHIYLRCRRNGAAAAAAARRLFAYLFTFLIMRRRALIWFICPFSLARPGSAVCNYLTCIIIGFALRILTNIEIWCHIWAEHEFHRANNGLGTVGRERFLPSYLLLTVAQVILPSKVLHCNWA